MNYSNGHVPPLTSAPGLRRPRIVLYSHDTMGVGHLRRNLLIAQRLASMPPNANVLLLAGAREAGMFATGCGIDCVTLPAITKNARGQYASRSFNLTLDETLAVRSQIIAATVAAFRPDLFIVDKVPRGIGNELDATLRSLRGTSATRCVLGLREILDAPETVAREWRESRAESTIRRYYDEIWIYGDRSVFDPTTEYRFSSDVIEKVRFTGYLDQGSRLTDDSSLPGDVQTLPDKPYALCVVGGGQDGYRLAETFLGATLPDDWEGLVIGGPFMPVAMKEQLRLSAKRHQRMRFVDSVAEADWFVARAERVVGMGGYNTVCSVLSFQKPALIVPRVSPRTEQLIRARRFNEMGALDMLHPRAATSEAITRWLNRDDVSCPSRSRTIDMQGLHRISKRVRSLLSPPTLRSRVASFQESPFYVAD